MATAQRPSNLHGYTIIIVVTTPLISSDILEYCRTPTYGHLGSARGHLVIIMATFFQPGEMAIHFRIPVINLR